MTTTFLIGMPALALSGALMFLLPQFASEVGRYCSQALRSRFSKSASFNTSSR
jgi:hypothetical protein